jgi:hypothetical protein
MTFLLNWKYSPQFSATWDDSISPQDFHAYSDPRSTQSAMAGQIEIRLESMDVQESLECYRHK